MGKLHQAQKVKYAVLNAPYLIPSLLEKPYNKQMTLSILNKMLNRSCGIEIECFGSLCLSFDKIIHNKKINLNLKQTFCRDEVIKYYNITDYSEDSPYSQPDESLIDDITDYNQSFNEHKIRISDWRQLNGLYEILLDMKKYCRLNTASGIHIHVDITDVWDALRSNKYKLEDHFESTLTPKLDYIEQIFYPNSHYKGKYNNNKTVATTKLYNWVSIRLGTCTIEFRIAPMSFEYTDIARWCVELCQLVNWSIKQNKELARKCNIRLKNNC